MTLRDQLIRDEGCVLRVYRDSRGILTAGVGHNCEAHEKAQPELMKEGTPISQDLADHWLACDIAKAQEDVEKYLPWTAALDAPRRECLVNMAFNMGIGKLLGFHRTLTMIEAGNYDGAAEAMLESLWAKQVGPRAHRLSTQMKTGIMQ